MYNAFLDGSIHVPGKDLCDMSGATGRTREEFTVYNVMLPRKYHSQWQGNLLERRCKARTAVFPGCISTALPWLHGTGRWHSCHVGSLKQTFQCIQGSMPQTRQAIS